MSWLSRLNPRSGRSAAPSAAPSSPCTADPETCLMVFENHWRQVSWILDQRDTSSASDDSTAVRNNTDQMLCSSAEERPAESAESGSCVAPMGPISESVVTENISERSVQWHLRRGSDPDSQGASLKLFEMLIGQSQQPSSQHTAVLHPSSRSSGACADTELGCPPALENSLVSLLNQVCVSMARQPVVLEMSFRAAPAQQGSTNSSIFSLLVSFIHRDGAIGQQARDASSSVMAASASHEAVARYIAENSYFCPVLATGLSALYSSSPRKIEVRGDDWHSSRREDWIGVSSLVRFMNSLEFCNAVVQVAHPMVRSQLSDYLHNGFLVPVMGPASHKSSVDEMIASTAYSDLFLRSITETSLLKTFSRFISSHRHDNDTISDTSLTRISSNSRLCMVSLSLFRTLSSSHCEDIMSQLILRYLSPCTHVMSSQRRAIRETDMYGKSANKFSSSIPECCRSNGTSAADRDEDNPFWGKVSNNPSTETAAPARPSTPSRLSFFMRQQSSGGGSGGVASSNPTAADPLHSGPSASHTLPPDSPMHQQQTLSDCSEWDAGYSEYLKDARWGIEHCTWACRDWSAPYDGENPSPSTAPPPPPPPTSNPSSAMFPEHFSLQHGGSSSTPPSQQRARSEWSSSDRDSGEWDVTIGKNNCISLTPRSKKRTLQTEELLPKPMPPLIPSSSAASPLSASHSTSSPSQHIPASTITLSYQPMFNGTVGQGDACSDRGLEVKKVKRDLGDQQFSDENANQNGSPIPYSRHGHTPVPQSVFKSRSDGKSLQFPTSTCASDTNQLPNNNSGPHRTSSDLPETSQSQQSVERLIEESLEQAPDDPQQLPGEANGQGISIEAFTQESRESEDRVKERSQATSRQSDSAADSPSAEQQEEEQLSTASTAKSSDVKGEGSEVGNFSPARSLNQPASQPYTGPFMVVSFAKLENMLQNSLYVNISLTGIVAQLACYPQPLLRSFSLNTNMVFQPSVKSSIQVLGSVKNRIEAFAASHEDFPAMSRKAQHYSVARGKVDWTDMASAVPPSRRSDSLVKSRKPSLGDSILRHTNSPTRARHAAQLALAHVRDGGQSSHSALFRGGGGSSGLEKQAEASRVKNAVYCAVIFCEFLKELAAMAQEHAVTLPFPRSQKAEE